MDKPKPFKLYKPNKAGSGSALQLDLNVEREAVFLDVSKQVGEQKFDWNNKITMKLSTSDLGKLLAVFNGKLREAKLFHQPNKGEYESSKQTKNTVLELSKGVQYGYQLKVSQQSIMGEVAQVNVPVSEDETEVIRVLIEKAVEEIYGW